MRLYHLAVTVPIGRPGTWRHHALDTVYARRLEGAIAVQRQLAWVARCNETLAHLDVAALLEPQNHGVAAAIAIGYRQCFNGGTRKFQLTEKHVKRCPSHSLQLHSQIMSVANKAIAHADSWLDQISVSMYVNQNGEFAELSTQHLKAAVFRKDEHEALASALLDLDNVLASDIEQLRSHCKEVAQNLTPTQRLNCAQVSLVPPDEALDGIKP